MLEIKSVHAERERALIWKENVRYIVAIVKKSIWLMLEVKGVQLVEKNEPCLT